MVSFLKLPFKFRQVIYLIKRLVLSAFFEGRWKERVLMTRFCTIFCLACFNVSRQRAHLDQCSQSFRSEHLRRSLREAPQVAARTG